MNEGVGATFKRVSSEVADEVKKTVKTLSGKADDVIKKTRQKWQESSIREMTLDDVVNMSNAKVKELVKKVDVEELTVVLKDASDDVKNKIIPNMTKTARKKYDELDAKIKKFKKSDLERYQKKINKELRDLFKKK
jgi:flagellar motor switch protein FliG